jgi:deoxyribodipyrimidine photo-lyase
MKNHSLIWLRNDLRIQDNPALDAALLAGGSVTAVYIHEETGVSRCPGGAARWWLERSLEKFAAQLAQKNIELII